MMIAIDFGTTRTKVAFLRQDGSGVELLRFGEDYRPYTPSLFYLPRDNGDPQFGDLAEEMLEDDPAGVIDIPKRRRRDGVLRAPNGRAIDFVTLMASFLRMLRNKAANEIPALGGQAPAAVTLTIPVGFGAQDRDTWTAAAKAAGFETVELVDEPIAASRAYFRAAGPNLSSVAVIDCGGGTVDWAWLRVDGGELRVDPAVPPGGLDTLGGHDIDAGILDALSERIKSQLPGGLEQLTDRARLLRQIRRTKELVSRGQKPGRLRFGEVSVPIAPEDVTDAMSRHFVGHVVNGVKPFFEQIMKERNGEKFQVLLVGGSSRTQGLRGALAALGCEVCDWDGADFGAALGALIASSTKGTSDVSRRDAIEDIKAHRAALERDWTQLMKVAMEESGKLYDLALGRLRQYVIESSSTFAHNKDGFCAAVSSKAAEFREAVGGIGDGTKEMMVGRTYTANEEDFVDAMRDDLWDWGTCASRPGLVLDLAKALSASRLELEVTLLPMERRLDRVHGLLVSLGHPRLHTDNLRGLSQSIVKGFLRIVEPTCHPCAESSIQPNPSLLLFEIVHPIVSLSLAVNIRNGYSWWQSSSSGSYLAPFEYSPTRPYVVGCMTQPAREKISKFGVALDSVILMLETEAGVG